MLDAMGLLLTDYRSVHRERVAGADGDYEIDVTARFNALNMNFLVLVECKHHKSPIKRELIQALHSKVQSAGAHKGALFSTSGFQSGALEFASAHGIATVQVVDGRSTYFTRSFGPPVEPPAWTNIPAVAGWLIAGDRHSLVSAGHGEYLREALGFSFPKPPES